MKRSKLFTVLSTFTKEEMKSFGKFISSPYFNSKRDFKPLFNTLTNHHPEFKSEILSEKNIFTKLYPDKEYNGNSDVSVRVLFSQLYVLAEKFMMIEGFQKNEAFQNNCLLKELYMKDLYDMFYSLKADIGTKIAKQKIDFSHLQNVILVECEFFNLKRAIKKKDIELLEKNLVICEEALITNFIEQMTGIDCYRDTDSLKGAVRTDLTNEFFRYFDFNSYVKSLKNSTQVYSDLIKIIYYISRMVKDKNFESGFHSLKKIFLKNYKSYSIKLTNKILISLMNYCSYQSKGDRNKFNKDYMLFYNIQIEENLITKDRDVFSIVHIRNYVKVLIQMKKYKEVDHYFETYYDHISEDIKADSINYSKGFVEFSRGNFKKALEYFSIVNFSIPMMIKDIKMFKLKCFYELGYFDLIKSEVDTYRHFLSTTALIPASYIKADKRYLMFLIRLSNYTEKDKKEELFNLKKDIESGPLNDNTRWILEKIEVQL